MTKARKIRRTILLLLLLFLVVCLGAGLYIANQNDLFQRRYHITTQSVKVNNGDFTCDLPMIQDDSQIYISVQALAAALGYTYAHNRLFTKIQFGEELLIRSEHPEIIMWHFEPYIGLQDLKEWEDFNVYDEDLTIESKRDFIYIDNYGQSYNYDWTEDHNYIMHGLGRIGEHNRSNTLDAFLENYALGDRVFEIDLYLTSDDKLAAMHDWGEGNMSRLFGDQLDESQIGQALSSEEFLSLKAYGEYQTMLFPDVVELMQQYPDFYLVIDTKVNKADIAKKQYQIIYDTIMETDPSLLSRIIPQVYSEAMYNAINEITHWNSMIYTLYRLPVNFNDSYVLNFAYKEGIKIITVDKKKQSPLLIKEFMERGIDVYMNTYNDTEEVEKLKAIGVKGVYTDYLHQEINPY